MNIDSDPGFARSLQGQLLRQSERREVAIFLRDGALWVADFIDGEGHLMDAVTWFRFNCGALFSPHARRRMVLESATPLSEELVTRIQRLHRPEAMASAAPRCDCSGVSPRVEQRTHQGDQADQAWAVNGTAS